ncbi:MAG: alpha/beta fold hydrolase [Clostridia bacterium]|nr:alpha/beta fold hydrolase [Clostridia bacterium]
MEYTKSEWQGFERLDFIFEGRDAIVVCPKEPNPARNWLLKTEYFGAFPAFEIEMLQRGYHVAHIKSSTRWCPPADTDTRAAFCDFLIRELHLAPRCVPVGMSCGGMQAVYFAAKYPQYVSALYLDAPVLNLLSCPCGVGAAKDILYEEFVKAMGLTVSDLINYRQHPIDFADMLIQEHIPVALVCGDSDCIVPYAENGQVLAEKYRSSTVPFFEVLKPGCDHHPHGLEDNAPLINFVERYGR